VEDVEDIEVHQRELHPCHRCNGPLLLAVSVPHSLRRADGVEVCGHRAVSLCPRCDIDDPAAQGVLAFFVLHASITESNLPDVALLLREWIDHVATRPPVYTDADLEEEVQQWESGEKY
jgi:hypothetical protein